MRSRSLGIIAAPLLILSLTSCTPTQGTAIQDVDRDELMRNPLYAERYWDDLTDRMVEIVLEEKDAQDARTMATVDEVRRGALQQAQEASRRKREGTFGSFVSIKETVNGVALLRSRTVSLSPHFETSPGPNLHLILTTMLDPRDGAFPDPTSVDAGGLESPYGAQEYLLPENAKTETLRTVAVYDTKLKRLYGFAQLQ